MLRVFFGRFVLAAFLMMPLIATAETRVAFVVGNANYDHTSTLANPGRDATLVADTLAALGFETERHFNLTRSGIARELARFLAETAGADVTLFYFAGHGLQYEGRNYLVGTDARLETEFDIEAETLALDQVIGLMERNSRAALVFVDACRDNPLATRFYRSVYSGSRAVATRGLAPMSGGSEGTMITFAASPGQVAYDGAGQNSPFALALSRHLPTPGMEVLSLMKRVIRDVRDSTDGLQVPMVTNDLTAEIYLKQALLAQPQGAAVVDDVAPTGVSRQDSTAPLPPGIAPAALTIADGIATPQDFVTRKLSGKPLLSLALLHDPRRGSAASDSPAHLAFDVVRAVLATKPAGFLEQLAISLDYQTRADLTELRKRILRISDRAATLHRTLGLVSPRTSNEFLQSLVAERACGPALRLMQAGDAAPTDLTARDVAGRRLPWALAEKCGDANLARALETLEPWKTPRDPVAAQAFLRDGTSLWTLLMAEGMTQSGAFVPIPKLPVSFGDRRSMTAGLQKALASYRFYQSRVDGDWGPATNTAVTRYCGERLRLLLSSLDARPGAPDTGNGAERRHSLGYYRYALGQGVGNASQIHNIAWELLHRFQRTGAAAPPVQTFCTIPTEGGDLKVTFERGRVSLVNYDPHRVSAGAVMLYP